VSWDDETLLAIDLEPKPADRCRGEAPRILREQLNAYFEDARSGFDLRIALGGTRFQRRVWQAVRSIPTGTTRTYGDLAEGLATSARAVGGACRANPCPIVVPCHRVVARDGLGGFAGDVSGRRVAVKRWLLRHEGVELR
jgi:methylated-DNA-[protein]-cysteine S-methyltransferase